MKKIEAITEEYLNWTPVSLSVREVSRIHALKILNEETSFLKAKRILDAGCGDGHWWTHILSENELSKVHGLDISSREIDLAKKVISAERLDVTQDDFKDKIKIKSFDLIIGNCSLEHVFHIDKALANLYSVLEEGGTFILFVPTPYWALKGKSVGILNRISPRLSMSFSGLVNGFFQHWHLYHYRIWTSLLQSFGFKVDKTYGLGNSRTEFLFRLFLIPAFFSFVVKIFTGKYAEHYLRFIVPKFVVKKVSAMITEALDQKLVSPNAQDIFEYMIVCKK